MPRTKSPKTNGVKDAVPNPETKPATQTTENARPNVAAATPITAEPVTKAEAKMPQAPKSAAPKLEAVRTEPRNNVVPINVEEEIRRLAYLYSERRGFVPGHENEDWLNAEHEIMQRYRQHIAQSA